MEEIWPKEMEEKINEDVSIEQAEEQEGVLDFIDDNMPKKTVDDPLIQLMTDEFYRIKADPLNEIEYIAQEMFIEVWKNEGYESAEKRYKPVLEKVKKIRAELAKNQVENVEKDAIIAELNAQLEKAEKQV